MCKYASRYFVDSAIDCPLRTSRPSFVAFSPLRFSKTRVRRHTLSRLPTVQSTRKRQKPHKQYNIHVRLISRRGTAVVILTRALCCVVLPKYPLHFTSRGSGSAVRGSAHIFSTGPVIFTKGGGRFVLKTKSGSRLVAVVCGAMKLRSFRIELSSFSLAVKA